MILVLQVTKSLSTRKGKKQYRTVKTIVASPSRMDDIKRATNVIKLYEEAQRVVETDRATLADACYTMSNLRRAIQCTSIIYDEERCRYLALLD